MGDRSGLFANLIKTHGAKIDPHENSPMPFRKSDGEDSSGPKPSPIVSNQKNLNQVFCGSKGLELPSAWAFAHGWFLRQEMTLQA
jgi:hypothetical protein